MVTPFLPYTIQYTTLYTKHQTLTIDGAHSPATEALTEDCFKAHPLDFDQSKQAILRADGSRFPIPGTFVSEGTGNSLIMHARELIQPRFTVILPTHT